MEVSHILIYLSYLSGKRPGIQTCAMDAGKAKKNGERELSEERTPR
jgi:hypothetical protein